MLCVVLKVEGGIVLDDVEVELEVVGLEEDLEDELVDAELVESSLGSAILVVIIREEVEDLAADVNGASLVVN